MKKIIFVFLALIILYVLSNPKDQVFAAKKFVPKKTGVSNKKTTSLSIPSVVKYRPDKKAIFLSFSNFSGIESVSYSFTYITNDNPQGAGGNITIDNNPMQQRELLFGTCSTSICTYHNNIKEAKLILTAKYSNVRSSTKIYRIKSYF
jgi:hypothetical protein